MLKSAAKDAIASFLRSRTCFELVRQSGKIVVFETNIPIQLAFYALLEHELAAAPLWDSERREFVGLMTITDFVDVLRYYHDAHGKSGAAIEVVASRSIAQVLADPGSGLRFKHATPSTDPPVAALREYGNLVASHADTTLLEACDKMRRYRRRFLPVVAPEGCSVLAVATHVDVLDFFVSNFRDERRLFDQPVAELGIGTFANLATVTRETPLKDVLRLLEERDISSVPVVDANGRVTALYGRGDITFLATATDAESVVANLSTVVGDILRQRRAEEPLHTCSHDASLQAVFELFAQVQFRRLICLDDDARPVGVISPRDLLGYFLS